MEDGSGKLLEAERRLQEERQRAVVLEHHLEKMRLEPGRTSASQRAASRSKTGKGWSRVPPPRGCGGEGLVANGGAGQQSAAPFHLERERWEAEASCQVGLCRPLLLHVLSWPPRQTQESQSSVDPGGPGP